MVPRLRLEALHDANVNLRSPTTRRHKVPLGSAAASLPLLLAGLSADGLPLGPGPGSDRSRKSVEVVLPSPRSAFSETVLAQPPWGGSGGGLEGGLAVVSPSSARALVSVRSLWRLLCACRGRLLQHRTRFHVMSSTLLKPSSLNA